jgi:hypothetical protein
MKQLEGEDIDHFSGRIRYTVAQLKVWGVIVEDTRKRDIFLSGLWQTSITQQATISLLMSHDAAKTTFEEAVQMMKDCISLLNGKVTMSLKSSTDDKVEAVMDRKRRPEWNRPWPKRNAMDTKANGDEDRWYRGDDGRRRGWSNTGFKGRCYNCGKVGHMKRECQFPPRDQTVFTREHTLEGKDLEDEVQEEDKSHMARGDGGVGVTPKKANNTEKRNYILDGGATRSQENTPLALRNVKRVSREVEVASGEKLKTIAEGERGPVKKISVTPGIVTPLLSEYELLSMGYGINKVGVQWADIVDPRNGKVMGRASWGEDKLLRIDPADIKELADKANYTSAKLNDKLERWQNITFLPTPKLKELQSKGLVKGLDIPEEDFDKDRPLNKCIIQAGMTALPSKKKGDPDKYIPPIGHTMQVDLLGRLRTPGLRGEQYVMVMVDKGGGINLAYPMKYKSDALKRLQKGINFKRALGEPIWSIENDGASELVGQEARQYLRTNGIHPVIGAPYKHNHQANVEVEIRCLSSLARAMQLHAGLEKPFLQYYAFTHANFIRNRTTLFRRNGVAKTRYEWTHGIAPDLSQIPPWGCLGHAMVPMELQRTEGVKSVEAFFVGYDYNGKSTLVYVPSKRAVVRTGNFIWDEVSQKMHLEEQARTGEAQEHPFEIVDEDAHEDVDSDAETVKADSPVKVVTTTMKTTAGQATQQARRSGRTEPKAGYERIRVDTSMPDQHQADRMSVEDALGDPKDNIQLLWESIDRAMDFAYVTQAITTPLAILLEGPERKGWLDARTAELNALEAHNTWQLAVLPEGHKAFRHKWVAAKKLDENRQFTKYKVRLTFNGWNMQRGIDFKDSFAPTLRGTSLRILFSLAAELQLQVHHMDFENAYLNADVDEDVYMTIPEGLDVEAMALKAGLDLHKRLVLKVEKSLYGMKQAGRNWNLLVDKTLRAEGFLPCHGDPCLYSRRQGGDLVMVGLYVDDLAIVSKPGEQLKQLKKKLQEQYKMKDLGLMKDMLGCRILQENGEIKVDLEGYINKCLERFNMTDAHPVTTPLSPSTELTQDQCPVSKEERDDMSNVPYRELVGCLLYAAIVAFPEIQFACSKLSEFNANPGRPHWEAAKHCLRYLKGIKNEQLIFKNTGGKIILRGFVDSDFAGDKDGRKSRSGFLFYIGGNLISWTSKKQHRLGTSSTHAEIMAASLAAKEVVYLRGILGDLGFAQNWPTELYEDNGGCIQIAKGEGGTRSKHFELDDLYIQEKVGEDKVKMKYVASARNPADLLTKPTTPRELQKRLFLVYKPPF